MATHSKYREMFSQFLGDIASGNFSASDWQLLVVTNYHDEGLEEIRRQFVQASIEAGQWIPPDLPMSLRTLAKDLCSLLAGTDVK